MSKHDSSSSTSRSSGTNRTRKTRSAASGNQTQPIWQSLLFPFLLILIGSLPYLNSFRVPLLFDDIGAIPENPTIVSLRNFVAVFSPPTGTTVGGRPLLNFSLAVNYAISGVNVWSYHVVNVIIHILASLSLFGLLNLTFRSSRLSERSGGRASTLAFVCAALWLVHPLHTESVTYIVQRAESLVGLWYFLTFYLATRGFESGGSKWYVASVIACALGMATKEVMATAPVLLILYDRTFYAGTFRNALRTRPRFYVSVGLTLGIVFWLAAGGRPGSAGFGEGMTSWEYLRTQFAVILTYLKLCIVPHPLVFDYSWPVATRPAQFVPAGIAIGLVAGALIWGILHNSIVGFAGCWFFLILAPSSSIIPIVTEVAAEHRLYLPLAAMVVCCVLCLDYFITSLGSRFIRSTSIRYCKLAGASALILLSGTVTFVRNQDYQTSLRIWYDTVYKRPLNSRAHYNLAKALEEAGREDEAVTRYLKHVLILKPDYVEAHANVGLALARKGEFDEGIAHLQEAIRLRPGFAEGYNNMGLTLSRMGRTDEALQFFAQAVERKPQYAEAWYNRANALGAAGRQDEALQGYTRAVTIKPDFAAAHYNMGVCLESMGRQEAAVQSYRAALRARPAYPRALLNLGVLNARMGNKSEGRELLKRALQIQPDFHPARQALEQIPA